MGTKRRSRECGDLQPSTHIIASTANYWRTTATNESETISETQQCLTRQSQHLAMTRFNNKTSLRRWFIDRSVITMMDRLKTPTWVSVEFAAAVARAWRVRTGVRQDKIQSTDLLHTPGVLHQICQRKKPSMVYGKSQNPKAGNLQHLTLWCPLLPYGKAYSYNWLSMVLRLSQHNIGYTADGFYRSDDPTNSVKALKEGG